MCPFFLDPRRAPIPSCSSSTSYSSSSLSTLVVLVQDVVHGICSVFLVRHPQLLHVLPSPYLTHWYIWTPRLTFTFAISATTSHLVSQKHHTQTHSTKSFYIHLNNHSSYLDKGSSNLVWSVSSHSPGHEPSQEKLEPYAAVASSNITAQWGGGVMMAVPTMRKVRATERRSCCDLWTTGVNESFKLWSVDVGPSASDFLAASDNVCQVLPNFFHIQEAFIKTSKAIHTKPKSTCK